MGKDKLRKFTEFRQFNNTFDFPYEFKGKWKKEVFQNEHPLILELGCGKGEYTIALGREFTDKNFIGIDIKSNRMWKGAGIAGEEAIPNIRFVRLIIDRIPEFFEKGEVDEIWITFPDPYPKTRHAKHRLVHPRFLRLYREILKDGGIIHLKTDDDQLFDFTLEMFDKTGIQPELTDQNVHTNPEAHPHLKNIRTYYENLFMQRGRTIKYARFSLERYDDKRARDWEEVLKRNRHPGVLHP